MAFLCSAPSKHFQNGRSAVVPQLIAEPVNVCVDVFCRQLGIHAGGVVHDVVPQFFRVLLLELQAAADRQLHSMQSGPAKRSFRGDYAQRNR